MLIAYIGGVAGIMSIGFLMFTYRGFYRAAKNMRVRNHANVVHPLKQSGKGIRNSPQILSLLFLMGMVPCGLRAQTGASNETMATPTAATSASTASPAPAAPLAMPAMVGPLSTAAPATFDAGPFGKLQVTGILSGMAYLQSNHSPVDHLKNADVSNAQVFVQKTTGLFQYYLQAGAYNIPALGTPLLSTRNTVSDFYGALPQAYLKIAPKGNFSFLLGKLPTLIGAEDTFTFENLNIDRGLLWNQENAVNRGIQVNYSKGKLSSSLVWNDGFYSNRFNWLTGLVTYTASAANSLEFVAGGNYGHTGYSSIATPLYQNNSSIYNLIYTHTAKKWMLEPYIQATYVPFNSTVGITKSTSTFGGAILGDYTVTPRITLAARGEYLGSSGNSNNGAVNLLYGPGSKAWSLTVTPTYQNKAFFARMDVAIVGATGITAGDGFGATGKNTNQARAVVEAGFMF